MNSKSEIKNSKLLFVAVADINMHDIPFAGALFADFKVVKALDQWDQLFETVIAGVKIRLFFQDQVT